MTRPLYWRIRRKKISYLGHREGGGEGGDEMKQGVVVVVVLCV